jgi:NAD(P)-dependent dehydrogenase (short-subunit alcohol dehydrogenase family)
MFHHYMVGHPDDYWFRTMDVNLNGPYRTIKACLPAMIERKWGRIVNLASTAANVGADDHAAYCASKSGLLGLTRCVALEGAPHGVTCNAINPGFVASPQNFIRLEQKIAMEGSDLTVEQYREKLAQSYPQKRFVKARRSRGSRGSYSAR